jgi:hypothetical protein
MNMKTFSLALLMCILTLSCATKRPYEGTPVSHLWLRPNGSVGLNGISVEERDIATVLQERGVPTDEPVIMFIRHDIDRNRLRDVQSSLASAGYLWIRTSPMTSAVVIDGARNWAPNKTTGGDVQ